MDPLHTELASLAEDESVSVVLAVIVALFAALPEAVTDCQYEELLRTNQLLSVPALRLIRTSDLLAIGVPYGHAIQLMNALRPRAAAAVAVIPQAIQLQQQQKHRSRPSSRIRFAETGRNGAIDLRAWKVFVFAFVAFLRTMDLTPTLVDLAFTVAMDPCVVLPVGYNPSDPENAQIFDAVLLLNGGVPPDILLSVPPSILENRRGVELLQYLSSRVLSQSDASIGVLESQYKNRKTAVLYKDKDRR